MSSSRDTLEDTFSFADLVLQSLRKQRKMSFEASPCDVILRCGTSSSVFVHSCVLAAVSRMFCRLLRDRQQAGGALDVDLGNLFSAGGLTVADFEHLVDCLYEGKRLVSREDAVNGALGSVYAALELDPNVEFQALELKTVTKGFNIHPEKVQVSPMKGSLPSKELVQISGDGLSAAATSITTASKVNKEVAMDASLCSKCDLFFVSKEEFVSHRKMRACSKKFTCQTCGGVFNRVQDLITHLVDVRHGETVCSVCNLAAESQSAMEAHIRKHADDLTKPYFCHGCESRFSTRKRWQQHLPKHSTEATHICKICRKGFKWKHALTAHMVVHSDEKQFLCQECGFSTSHASTFKFHQKNHSGQMLRCEAVPGCTFQTIRKANLVQHHLTHSKEKLHQCEVCGRSFSLAKNMRRHARQHDRNAVNYKCTVPGCNFTSLRSDKYMEHTKRYQEAGEDNRNQQHRKPPAVVRPMPTFLQSVLQYNQRNRKTIKVVKKSTTSANGAPLLSTATATAPPNVLLLSSSAIPMPVHHERPQVTLQTEPMAVAANFNLKLVKNLFNVVGPPNKTVADTLGLETLLDTRASLEEPSVYSEEDGKEILFSQKDVDIAISNSVLMNSTAER